MAPSVPLQGAVDVVPLLGAIVGCHCSVVWLGGRRGVDVVPLLGAIAGCHSRVLDQFWGSGRGHCWVPFAGCHLLDAMCSTPFGGVDVVPLLGAIAGCHSNVLWSWFPLQSAIVMCYGGRRG